MKKRGLWQRILAAVYHYLLFFCLSAFLVSCTLSLFVTTLSRELGITLTAETLSRAAKLAFGCVVLISVLFTLVDSLRRRMTTERIAGHILAATRELVKGNFDTRIEPVGSMITDDTFNEIIDGFNQMAQELGSLETLRTDFIANVSHEMKTPLAVMQNYGTMLQMPDLPEQTRITYAKGVTEGARRMADMVSNILKLNRLENQQIYPQRLEFDLGEQLRENLLQFEDVWERGQIEIDADLQEDVTVLADRELLSLVWSNLLSNAFKFTPPGGTVLVRLTGDETYATVEVRDTGCGMTPEVGSHIFEKFYQGDPSRATQGNGLGLALVKRVVDILRGEITVESRLRAGTTFTVRIRRW